MSWAATAPAIAALLAGVEDCGQIYLGDKHVRDESRLQQLFRWVSAGGRREQLKGVRIVRDAISEDWWSSLRTQANEHYTLRVLQGASSRRGSEAEFQALLDRVWARFRNLDAIGSAVIMSAQSTPQVQQTTYGEELCYYAEIDLDLTEIYTLEASRQPAIKAATASARDDYQSIADELAAYLAEVPDSGRVHTEVPWVTDEVALREAFLVQGPAGVNQFRTWKVLRQSDREDRGLGGIVESDTRWKVLGHWGWADSVDTYDKFQRHLDAVRAKFRGVGVLGNTINPTMSLSSPLQIREIGARMYADTLCHFADGEITTKGVVYA